MADTKKKKIQETDPVDISLDDLAVMDPSAEARDDEQEDDLGNIED